MAKHLGTLIAKGDSEEGKSAKKMLEKTRLQFDFVDDNLMENDVPPHKMPLLITGFGNFSGVKQINDLLAAPFFKREFSL